MKKSPLVVRFVTAFIDLMGFSIVLPLLLHCRWDSYRIHSHFVQLLFEPAWGTALRPLWTSSSDSGDLTGTLAKIFGERRLVSVGLFCMILGLGLLPYSPGLKSLSIVLPVLVVEHGSTNASIASKIPRQQAPRTKVEF